MQKVTVPIQGMHCRSCELLISDAISEIPQVTKVIANFKKKEADIYSHTDIPMDKISEAVEKVGYKVGVEEKKSWFSHDQKVYEEFILAFGIAAVLYIVGKKLGLFEINLIPDGSAESPWVVLLVGITAGFSTCMALIGGLVLSLSAKHAAKHPEATPTQNFRPHIFFNLGRIISFFVLGGMMGLLGEAMQLSNSTLGLISLVVGAFMLILGLQLIELFPRLKRISLTLPSGLAKLLGIKNREQKEYSHTNSMMLGAVTFFLPCGFTQAMQVYAISTGSFWQGAMVMGTFALGTAPGLLGIGGLSSLFKGTTGKVFFKLAGIVVVAFAWINISSGLTLARSGDLNTNPPGQNPPVRTPPDTTPPTTPPGENPGENPPQEIPDGEVQVIEMTQKFNGYFPNEFTIKKGVPVKWVITSETAYSCASAIMIPDLGIGMYLEEGENVIEFTAEKTGVLEFSCSMGMFRGAFNVIN